MEQIRRSRKMLPLEIAGAIAVSILAPLFHFLFEWSGENHFVGLFSAVNESVWEHTKILFFPFLFVAIAQYFIAKPDFCRFLIAKTISLGLIILLMISFFYTYTGAFGIESVAIDIGSTFVLTAIAFIVSYHVYRSKKPYDNYIVFYFVLFIVLLLMQLLFTAFPPHIPLFKDSVTGLYGFPVS